MKFRACELFVSTLQETSKKCFLMFKTLKELWISQQKNYSEVCHKHTLQPLKLKLRNNLFN